MSQFSVLGDLVIFSGLQGIEGGYGVNTVIYVSSFSAVSLPKIKSLYLQGLGAVFYVRA